MQGELVRLVESERQLDAELAEVRVRAAELVRLAGERAEAMRRRLDADIAEATATLRATIDAEQLTALAQVQADARRQVERFDCATRERSGSLADLVVARLVSLGPA